ncbi:hypothetical protein [Clostridium sp. ZS2-4]|nr:hypothetical protein [Clostridium sp. ZS2-4]MCY6355343.1 hypothetical protein [Clostridium sp. ZS2-4]
MVSFFVFQKLKKLKNLLNITKLERGLLTAIMNGDDSKVNKLICHENKNT